jgi:hypothetical protein
MFHHQNPFRLFLLKKKSGVVPWGLTTAMAFHLFYENKIILPFPHAQAF